MGPERHYHQEWARRGTTIRSGPGEALPSGVGPERHYHQEVGEEEGLV